MTVDGRPVAVADLAGMVVTAPNRAPVASDQSLTGTEDMPVTGSVGAVDPDGDALSYGIGAGPAHGRLVLEADGRFTYRPDADYAGTDSFRIDVSDGRGGMTAQTVTVTLDGVNDAPSAVTLDGAAIAEHASAGTVVGTARGSDPDGDALTYSLADDVGGRFAIDTATGVLSVAAGADLDYAQAPAHAVTVRATDAGGLATDRVFHIGVTATRNDGAADIDGLSPAEERALEAAEAQDGGNDAVTGDWQAETLDGGAGNDTLGSGGGTLLGGAGDDVLTGGSEDDTLGSGSGNDLIAGGENDDSIEGGSGYDTLRFEGERLVVTGADAGGVHGLETIDLSHSGRQVLILNEQGILADTGGAPLYVTGNRDDLVTFKESGWKRGGAETVGSVLYNRYSRGTTTVYVQDGVRMFGDLVVTGTAGDDVLTAPSGVGHVVVFGEGGDDTLRFGAGFWHEIAHLVRIDDDLHVLFDAQGGPAGEDGYARDRVTIMGHFAANGAAGVGDGSVRPIEFADGVVWPVWGDELLLGSTGDDTVAIEPGFGSHSPHADAGVNVVRFGADVTADDLRLSRKGDDLEIRIAGTDRSLLLFNHFSAEALAGAGNGGVELADGTRWRVRGSDVAIGSGGDDRVVFGLDGGQTTLYGSAGADTIAFATTIDPDRMRLSREGDDLRLSYEGSGASWLIEQHFDGDPDGYRTIRFGDGTEWAIDNTRLIAGTAADERVELAPGWSWRPASPRRRWLCAATATRWSSRSATPTTGWWCSTTSTARAPATACCAA